MNRLMNAVKQSLYLGPLMALGFVVTGCQPTERTIIKIDGSSTVFPITEAMAEEFQAQNRNTMITVGVSGTGGGMKKFCRGETDISNASRPIRKNEMASCRESGISYFEIPVAFDALTVVIHPKNTWAEQLTIAQLKKMWAPEAQDTMLNWKQINPAWPDVPLALYGPGADSGTFDYFTDAVMGKSKSSRGDFTASEDDNVLVTGVANDVNALGYFGFAYYQENQDKLKAASVVNPQGKAVPPTVQSVEDGTYAPLSRPVFIYVNAASAQKPEVKSFVEFYLNQAAALVPQTGYVPLPADHYEAYRSRFAAGEGLGTAYDGGNDVGVSIAELLSRTPKL